jgi:hypothetical protein
MLLVVSMMTLTLLTALCGAMVLGTVAETAIAASYREGHETFYAAEAIGEFVVQELAAASDWDAIVAGDTLSDFVDGPPSGTRRVGAATIDLAAATASLSAATGDARVSYRLYAYGHLASLLPAVARSCCYVVVWLADVAETGQPQVLRIVGRAYGPTGSRRSIMLSVDRPHAPGAAVRVLSWHELR